MGSPENLTGSILVAHPTLRDPNFRRTILFLSHHDRDEGATGFILNRPVNDEVTGVSGLEDVPVFFGGPVEPSTIVLTSLQWREHPAAVAFRMFAGPSGDGGIEPEWREGLRAFAGYAGWGEGQLEREIDEDAWIVVPPTRELIMMPEPGSAWRAIMRHSGAIMHLLSEAPDDPGRN